MRASKGGGRLKSYNQENRFKVQPYEHDEVHISGAEGIFNDKEIVRAFRSYLKRAMEHSRGSPDKVIFTIERISGDLVKIPALTITTLECNSPEEARILITERLLGLGITKAAVEAALGIIVSASAMRGASLIRTKSGVRAEPDKSRGVRASRLGIDKGFRRKLGVKLNRLGINTERVKEALILASKVAHHKDILAELCVSDDPDYTTGYIASSRHGYLRIPNIKNKGDMSGGRVFFISEDAYIPGLINYLEKTPVIIGD